MDEKGFYLVNTREAPEETIRAVEEALSRADRSVPSGVSTIHTVCPKGDEKKLWDQFVESKINVGVVKLQCGQDLLQQAKLAVAFVPNESEGRLQRAHPCPEPSVSVFIPLRNGLGPENGMCKVYPGSQKIQTEEELRASGIRPMQIRVGATEALVASGELWMEVSKHGGGTFMWLGFSDDPVGLHFSKYTPWFILASNGGNEEDWASPEGLAAQIRREGRMTGYSSFYSGSGSA